METIIMADAKVSKLTEVYLKIKTKREELSAEFKEADEALVSQQDKIKAALLDYLKENDVDSVKTAYGTFFRSVKQRFWTNDWGSMHEFIIEHRVPELLDKRLNQKHVREFLDENPELLPKGLNADSEYTLSIRKPKK
tara:strand:- start:123 stop:536 length:414 start_codon:yes stop_codon:yes gene_type:complete